MKKRILLIMYCIVMALLCACGQVQENEEVGNEEMIVDEVNTETEFVEASIEPASAEELIQIKVLIKEVEVDEDTEVSTYYAYDEKGHIITKECTFASENINEKYYSEWIYEEDGSYIENFYIVSDSDIDSLSAESFYDKNGNLLKVSDYFFRYAREYTYDEKGNVTGGVSYSLVGESDDVSLWEYNKSGELEYDYSADGNLIEYRIVGSNGRISSKTQYEYDHKGQLIKEEQFSYSPDEYFSEGYRYQYDDEGKLICTTRYNEDAKGAFQTIEEITYEYDEDGDLIKEKSIFYWNSGNSSEETITIYEYDYITIK